MNVVPGDQQGSLLRTIDRGLSRVEDWFNDFAGLVIFALMFVTMAEVLGRKLFNAPLPGTIDIIELSMVSFAFLGAAYCQRHGTHVRMDIVVGHMRGRLMWAVEAFAVAAALVYITIITWKSFSHFLRAYEIGDSTIDTQLQVWPSKLLVPIALALLAIRLAVQLWGYVRLVALPEAAPVGVPVVKHVSEQAEEQIQEVLGKIADTRLPEEQQPPVGGSRDSQ